MSTVKKAISKALFVGVAAVGMTVASGSFAANGKADSDKFDYASATIEKLVAVSEKGDIRAQTELWKRFLDQQNYVEATKWLRKAAEQGDPRAQFNLALSYEKGQGIEKSETEAVKWYRKSADQGDALAQLNLGICYSIGRGIRQSYTEALKWLHKSADQNYSLAQGALGYFYEEGLGVRQDYKKAKEYYGLACDNGSDQGCENYARLNKRGI